MRRRVAIGAARRRSSALYGAWLLLSRRTSTSSSTPASGWPAASCCTTACSRRWSLLALGALAVAAAAARRPGPRPSSAFVVLGSVTLLAVPGARAVRRPAGQPDPARPQLHGRLAGARRADVLVGRGRRSYARERSRREVTVARVLVVDDDPTVREVVVSYLRAAGHEVVEAARRRGRAGARCATRRADLVVLDLMLPGIDGLEVCRRLRDDRRRPGDHADRARRGDRPGRRARGRRRRLRHQAVQPARAGAAGRLGAAPGRRPRPRRRAGSIDGDLVVDRGRHAAYRWTASALALTGREFDLLRFLLAPPRARRSPATSCCSRCGAGRSATSRP